MTLWLTLIPLTVLSLCGSVTIGGGGGGGGGGGVAEGGGGGVSRCRNGNHPTPAKGTSMSGCLHYFSERHGVLLTPNFPGPFSVPFSCSWIINATGYEPDSFITLYLTQMYMTRGVHVSHPVSLSYVSCVFYIF